MPGPLHGFRIVDLTSNISGPLATMILADQGADVIKVENPQGGDHTRASANRRGGFSASFLNNNRNKRSIVLDLKEPARASRRCCGSPPPPTCSCRISGPASPSAWAWARPPCARWRRRSSMSRSAASARPGRTRRSRCTIR